MNKLKINLIGVMFAVAIILAPTVVYGLSCDLENTGVGGSCSGDKTCVYSMSNNTNAHAGNCDAYSWKMCCDGLTSATIKTEDVDCSADEQGILSLFAISGSHAEKYNIGAYKNNVCIDPVDDIIVCDYKIGSCDTGDTCLGSLFSDTNSHMAQCSDASYNIKICCWADIPEGTCHNHSVEGWAWSSNIGWISFSCEDRYELGAGSDYGVDINADTKEFSGYAWSPNIGWISFNKTDLAECPSGDCVAKLVGGEVFGWAKVLSTGEFIKLRGFTDETIPQEFGVYLESGEFHGWAYESEIMGWISFNCEDRGICGTSDYKVIADFNFPPDKPTELTISNWDNCSFKEKSIPTFSWTYSGMYPQGGYEIWVDDDSDFSDIISVGKFNDLVEPCVSTNYTYTLDLENDNDSDWLSELAWNTPYYWKVKVKDTIGSESVWSDTETFTTHIHAYPWVDFSYIPSSPIVGNEIQFCSVVDEAECSELAEDDMSYFYDGGDSSVWSWSWDFDGDEIEDSAISNPIYTYLIPGLFENMLSLKITDSDGFFCAKTPDIKIDLPLPFWKEIMPF